MVWRSGETLWHADKVHDKRRDTCGVVAHLFLNKNMNYDKYEIIAHLKHAKDLLAQWFCEYYFEEEDSYDYYWIGSSGGSVSGCTLWVGDIFVDLDDIVDIMENDIPREVFMSWYSFRVEWFDNTYTWEDEFDTQIIDKVNLKSYAKIRWEGTHDDYVAWNKEQERIRQTPEFKKQCEEDLKKITDKGMEELKKYITKK